MLGSVYQMTPFAAAARGASRLLLPLLLALCASVVALLGSPQPAAWAHSTLVQASIPPGSFLPALPPSLTLSFSESLSGRLSSLTVTGPQGDNASVGASLTLSDPRTLRVDLVGHGGGTYRVYWTTVSAQDGQVVTGAYSFAVAYVSAPRALSSQVSARHTRTLGVIGLVAAIVHWLLLLIAIAWAGIALLEAPSGASAARAATGGIDAWIASLVPYVRGVRARLLEVLLGLLVFGWLLEAAQTATAGRVSLIGGLEALASGHLGLLRLVLLAMPLLAVVDQHLAAPQPAPNSRLPHVAAVSRRQVPALGRWGHLAVAALFLLALAASGHADGVPDITLSAVVLAWLHSLAAAAWIGGMAYFALVALPVLENTDLDKRAPLTLGLLRRYSVFAAVGIAVLAITGLFAGQVEVGSRGNLTGSSYGHALSLKLVLVVACLGLTLYLLTVQRAHVERIWTGRQRLESLGALDRLGRSLRIGLALGALVLGATSILWSDVPAVATPLPTGVALLPAVPRGWWQPVGLSGQVVHRLLFAPHDRHTLWAATSHGVWRSTDDQRTWHLRGASLGKLSILDLMAIDGGHGLLAAGANGQIYRTYDGGAHWRRMGRPFGHHPLRVLASHGSVLLAGGDDGLFRSTDDSRHWRRVLGLSISTVYWSPPAGSFLAGTRYGSWQILSGGPTAQAWQELPNPPSTQAGVLALASTGSMVPRFIGGTGGAGLWVAPAATGSWTPAAGLPSGSIVAALLPDRSTLGLLYLGTAAAGPYVSADGGTSWTPLGSGGPQSIANLVLRPGPTRILYAATSDGVYKLAIQSSP